LFGNLNIKIFKLNGLKQATGCAQQKFNTDKCLVAFFCAMLF